MTNNDSRKILVLGFGNTILGDDGVGIRAVREIKKNWTEKPSVNIIEASLGGMVLLDLVAGFDHVIVIDAIMTDDEERAGFVYELSLDDLDDVIQPYASHALDLKTTMELGRRLGYKMPESVKIYAVKIEENTIFREGLTQPVEKAAESVAQRVLTELENTG